MPVTVEELASALKRMKGGRTGAEDGLVAEMLQTGHSGLLEIIAEFFTDILAGKLEPPVDWKVARLSVIFKKGDAKEPSNYRPISIIPVMAKLFSVILYCRIRETLENLCTEEQYGFRRGRGCDDVNHILKMVVEKSAEWGEELWMAALDVEKAFDKVYHHELFNVLLQGKVDASAVFVLRRLYRGMQAYVALRPGVESRRFEIQRGVRQGDPLSPVLFNLVLTSVLQELQVVWQRRGYGTNVGQDLWGHRLTHVAFADDTTLIARSWVSLKRMVLSLRAALGKRGLKLHPTKCKAQTNSVSAQRGVIRISDDFDLNVLAEEDCLEVLGTNLSPQDPTKAEVKHRIAVAWRKFWALKASLLNDRVSRKRRLQLFEASVSSSFLFGTHAWTPREDELRMMRSVQNKMLRRICHTPRHPTEEWVPWIKRATHRARQLAQEAGVRDWLQAHAARKWHWAGHAARREASTWLWRVTFWRDSDWNAGALESGLWRPFRPSRRRCHAG